MQFAYRPISLLSIFDKLLEKLMYKRLLHFLEKNRVLFERQFGFRTMYSTEYAILSFVDKVQELFVIIHVEYFWMKSK
jgi:hypothetical protein